MIDQLLASPDCGMFRPDEEHLPQAKFLQPCRLALATTGTTLFESMEQRPLLACVWEQLVMQHERDAWVRHMMKDDQDPSGYLHDRVADGLYSQDQHTRTRCG